DDQAAPREVHLALDLRGQPDHHAAGELQAVLVHVVIDGQILRGDGDAEQGEAAVDADVDVLELVVLDLDAGVGGGAEGGGELVEGPARAAGRDGQAAEDVDLLRVGQVRDRQPVEVEVQLQQVEAGGDAHLELRELG